MKKLFLFITILLSSLQAFVDVFNQLQLPEDQRVTISAALMLSILFLDGIKRYFDPATNTNTLWVTASLFVVYIIGAITTNQQYLLDLGISAESQVYMRLAFSIITISLTQTVNTLAPEASSDKP